MALENTARNFLEQLMAAAAPGGFEADVQNVVRDYLAKRLPADRRLEIDRNDNLVAAVRWGNRPRIALLAHADTVGLIVEEVDPRGFLRVGMIGRPRAEALVGQRVSVLAREGAIPGVVYRREDGEQKAEVSDLAVDCGFAKADEARKRVRPGDAICWSRPPIDLYDGRIVGPGTDNRAGVFVAAQTLLAAADAPPDAPCVVCASVTLEEGPTHMGAIHTVGRIEPDVLLVVDSTEADDFRGGDRIKLGGGPLIARGGCVHHKTADALIALAQKAGIPHQIEPTGRGTGTDLESALTAAGADCVGALVSFPHRHYHTPNEVVDLADLEATIDLLTRFVTDPPDVL